MSRSLRPSLAVLWTAVALLFWLAGCETPAAAVPEPDAPLPQIDWQRSLEAAEALAKAEQRPLLIAVNMDGESASDRIWRENYRDSAFVAAANRCVCIAASLFRHNARDHDDEGRRIPCPRFGCITCGEHIAAEPLLFAKLLADGERVAPRHALVMPDGKKAFDLSLCFDLRDVDRALVEAVRDVPMRRVPVPADATWAQLAARRDHAGRLALEERLAERAAAGDEKQVLAALAAIREFGDEGALDALRRVGPVPAWPDHYEVAVAVRPALVAAAHARGLGAALAAVWRERIDAEERLVIDLQAVHDPDAPAFALLADLDGLGVPTRSFLLAHSVIGTHAEAARENLRRLLPAGEAAAVHVEWARFVPVLADPLLDPPEPPHPQVWQVWPTGAEMPDAEVLARTLEELDAEARNLPADRRADWDARYAKASLDLGRRRMETQGKDVQLLLEDAELHWQRALAAEPAQAAWWIERARTAYFLGRFVEQAEFGRRAFALANGGRSAADPVTDPVAIEALRWIGDACARLLGERANGDAATELRGLAEGLRALTRVAESERATAKDLLSLASFYGALSLQGAELAIAEAGVQQFRADRDLRMLLNSNLRARGLNVAGRATALARIDKGSADAAWWAAYGQMLMAEAARRTDWDARAAGRYDLARQQFARAMALQPDYTENCRQMTALCWLGEGHASVFADRRRAADCLVEAAALQVPLGELRDGLGYDVLDLTDKILEWRAAGPTDVDSGELLTRLLAAAPGTPFYAVAIADAELREALRADGRNPQRVLRDTVDAGGKKIRMAMGLATDDGDAYLQRSLAALRRVGGLLVAQDDKVALAQSATIAAERDLERHRLAAVAGYLAEAAAALGHEPPPAGADEKTLVTFAATLRAELGEARPRERAGR